MQILKTITDLDLGIEPVKSTITRERCASRAVVFDKDNNVALLDATLKNYHKLPGGGIEENEDFTQALKRECKEEYISAKGLTRSPEGLPVLSVLLPPMRSWIGSEP